MTLEDLIARGEALTNGPDLWALMLDFAHDRGFAMVSYHHTMLEGETAPFLLREDGFPESWVCRYLQQRLYLVDPIPDLALATTEPFLWSDTGRLRALSRHQSSYLDLLVAEGLGDGLAVPVFGPHGRNGYVGLGFGGPALPLHATDIREVQLAAQFGHLSYCRLLGAVSPLDLPALTPREREVLDWVARGKSNGVIADILGVAPSTVDTLLRRIFGKLGVNDRVSAAIKGVGAGLVFPGI
jgi:DNA-binding CsgD family transcriptional regulator